MAVVDEACNRTHRFLTAPRDEVFAVMCCQQAFFRSNCGAMDNKGGTVGVCCRSSREI
jgi:hypothetical protein